jgi:hypothetical protein
MRGGGLNDPDLFGLGQGAFLVRLPPSVLGGLEVKRDDEIHVQQGRLDHAGQGGAQGVAFVLAAE